MKFDNDDIVFIESSFPSEYYHGMIGRFFERVVSVVPYNIVRGIDFGQYAIGGARFVFCTTDPMPIGIRLATEHEQFLYFILGPMALKETE
jgi:hypothetical protein